MEKRNEIYILVVRLYDLWNELEDISNSDRTRTDIEIEFQTIMEEIHSLLY